MSHPSIHESDSAGRTIATYHLLPSSSPSSSSSNTKLASGYDVSVESGGREVLEKRRGKGKGKGKGKEKRVRDGDEEKWRVDVVVREVVSFFFLVSIIGWLFFYMV